MGANPWRAGQPMDDESCHQATSAVFGKIEPWTIWLLSSFWSGTVVCDYTLMLNRAGTRHLVKKQGPGLEYVSMTPNLSSLLKTVEGHGWSFRIRSCSESYSRRPLHGTSATASARLLVVLTKVRGYR
jgi:hypothetical protein